MMFTILRAADQHISVISMHLILLPLEMIKGITEQVGFYTYYTKWLPLSTLCAQTCVVVGVRHSQDCHFRLPLDALAAETLISYQVQNDLAVFNLPYHVIKRAASLPFPFITALLYCVLLSFFFALVCLTSFLFPKCYWLTLRFNSNIPYTVLFVFCIAQHKAEPSISQSHVITVLLYNRLFLWSLSVWNWIPVLVE